MSSLANELGRFPTDQEVAGRVDLGDAGLAHPHHLGDLLHMEVLLIVEGQHDLLVLLQRRDA